MGIQGINLPVQEEAREVFAQCFRILNSKFLDDDDCGNVVEMLQHLVHTYNYAAASLNLAHIYERGLEPAIDPDKVQAASYFVDCLTSPFARRDCSDAVLEEASMALCNLDVSDHIEALRDITRGKGAGEISMVQKWVTFAIGKRKLSAENKGTDARTGTPSHLSRRGTTYDNSNGVTSAPPPGAQSKPDVALIAESQPSKANVTLAVESQGSEANVAPTAQSQGEKAIATPAVEPELSEEDTKIFALKEAANDLYKQGVVPGNKHGPKLLLAATEKYKDAFSLRASGIIALNCAQAYVKLEEWGDAAHWATVALDIGKTTEDSVWVAKAYHRLALSLIRIGKWADAASAIDGGLTLLGFAAGQNFVDLARQVPAEEIEGYAWSTACVEKQHIDLERSICGVWAYGAGCYKLSIEPWGSFVFEENDIRVDLKQSKTCQTHWSGEFALIPGLRLDMRYNRTADTITSTFTPPPDMPEKERSKVPPAFVAKRAAQAPSPTVKPAVTECPVDARPELAPPAVEAKPVAGPEEVTIEGAPNGFNGTYKRTLPDVNECPLYRLDTAAYLWYRGQWGISQRPPDPSPFKCPFLLRIANSSTHPHPLYAPAKWEATGPNFPHDRAMYPCDARVVGAKAWVKRKRVEKDRDGDEAGTNAITPQVIYAEGLAPGYYHKNSPSLYTKDDGARIERRNGMWYMGALARSPALLGAQWERADLQVASMLLTQETTVYRKDRTIVVRGFPACIHHAAAVSGALTIGGDDSLKSALVDRSVTCVRLTIAGDTVEFPCRLNEGDGRVKWSKAQKTFIIT